jgi:excisionase family DNA binding protein
LDGSAKFGRDGAGFAGRDLSEAIGGAVDRHGAGAEHLACPTSRIYDLVSQRRLTPRRDGRRLLFKRSHLDAAIEALS